MANQKKLETLSALRKFMSTIIAKLEKDKISPELATKLGYLCNIQKSIISDSSIEERLNELEKRIEETKK